MEGISFYTKLYAQGASDNYSCSCKLKQISVSVFFFNICCMLDAPMNGLGEAATTSAVSFLMLKLYQFPIVRPLVNFEFYGKVFFFLKLPDIVMCRSILVTLSWLLSHFSLWRYHW